MRTWREVRNSFDTVSIVETRKETFPGYHVFLSTRIYYITIAFCSCERGSEKIRSMSSVASCCFFR